MAARGPNSQRDITPFGKAWLCGILFALALAVLTAPFGISQDIVLSGFLNARQSLAIVIGVTILSIVIGVSQSRQSARVRATVVPLVFGLSSLVSSSMLLSNLRPLIEPAVDFPPAKTQKFAARLPILQAHATRDGGAIEARPVGPIISIPISRQDFDFMASHRPPENDSPMAGIVASDGYFCANVTLQKSGNALRIRGVAHTALPPGSVIICPPHAP